EWATLEPHQGKVRCLAFTRDCNTLAVATTGQLSGGDSGGWKNGEIKLWNLDARRRIATLRGHNEGVNTVAFSPEEKMLASGGDGGTIKLWDVAKEKELATLKGHKGDVAALAFTPDGTKLLSGGGFLNRPDADEGELLLWDVAGGKILRTFKGHG